MHSRLNYSVLFAILTVFMFGCAQHPEEKSAKIDDLLISFTVAMQARDYPGAIETLTEDDQLKLLNGTGGLKEEFIPGMRSLKLSTLRENKLTLDSQGKLVGMIPIIEKATAAIKLSDAQKNSDLLKKVNQMKEAKKTALSDSTTLADSTQQGSELSSSSNSSSSTESIEEESAETMDEEKTEEIESPSNED